MGIIRVTIWVIGVINLLTKSPDPPSRVQGLGFKELLFRGNLRGMESRGRV